MIEFPTSPYVPSGYTPSSISMQEVTLAYVPNSCASNASCKLHIALHGCGQTLGSIGTLFTTNTGYNPWADNNELVILYPQAAENMLLGNPSGCFDWWGYLNNAESYDTKQGLQIQTIHNMMEAIAAGFKA
jgi:poly(3-hydroxybutyrate) depolymerase